MKNILQAVSAELERACMKFVPFTSAHEGYAILLEEVDELWDEIKKQYDVRTKERMAKEAIQIAAMAIRFVQDICSSDAPATIELDPVVSTEKYGKS